MSKRLKAHVPYLHVLVNGNSKQREGILRGANKELIYCVCECALNVLQGNVHLLPAEKNTLKKYRRRLRDLTDKKIALSKKKTAFTETERRVDFSSDSPSSYFASWCVV